MSSDLEKQAKTLRELGERSKIITEELIWSRCYNRDLYPNRDNVFLSESEKEDRRKEISALWVGLETAQEIIKTELNSVTELYNFAREQLSATIDDLEKKLAKQSASLDEQKKRLRRIMQYLRIDCNQNPSFEYCIQKCSLQCETCREGQEIREVFGENASVSLDEGENRHAQKRNT